MESPSTNLSRTSLVVRTVELARGGGKTSSKRNPASSVGASTPPAAVHTARDGSGTRGVHRFLRGTHGQRVSGTGRQMQSQHRSGCPWGRRGIHHLTHDFLILDQRSTCLEHPRCLFSREFANLDVSGTPPRTSAAGWRRDQPPTTGRRGVSDIGRLVPSVGC